MKATLSEMTFSCVILLYCLRFGSEFLTSECPGVPEWQQEQVPALLPPQGRRLACTDGSPTG